MDFIFNTIPFSLVPFDQESFLENKAKFVVVVTDIETGDAVYYEKNELKNDYMKIFKATCSLPFVAKPVYYKKRIIMDGGLADPVPIEKSIGDGNSRNVLVLTRPKGYRKKYSPLHLFLARLRYRNLKGLHKALSNRHKKYNDTMDMIDMLEESGQAFLIRPDEEIDAGRVERNKQKLYAAYDHGFEDASSRYEKLESFLQL